MPDAMVTAITLVPDDKGVHLQQMPAALGALFH